MKEIGVIDNMENGVGMSSMEIDNFVNENGSMPFQMNNDPFLYNQFSNNAAPYDPFSYELFPEQLSEQFFGNDF